jgi:cyclic dehypoxanthinyl futalosine synthase
MMFGHIETIEERIEHLRRLRDLQDETAGFTAFILWPFQPEGTALGRVKRMPLGEQGAGRRAQGAGEERDRETEGRRDEEGTNGRPLDSSAPRPLSPSSADAPRRTRPDYLPDGKHLLLAEGNEYLRMLGLARLYLDNIPNMQSSWVTMGPKIGQLALFYGANDMGSIMMEENVVSQAGTTFRMNEAQIRRAITDAGWTPQQRDQYYRPVRRDA